MATRPQFEKIMEYIGIAKNEGARCVLGGHVRTGEGFGADQFVEPTIFVDLSNDMRIAQEEVFGPVLSVIKFTDEEDAIRIANDVCFGLASGVWTISRHRAMLMSSRIKAGTVWVNNYRFTSFTTSFGGYKDSGMGYEGGVEAVKEYLETKSVWIFTDLDMPDSEASFDAAIHFNHPVWANATSTYLFTEELIPICSPQSVGGRYCRKPADLLDYVLMYKTGRPETWSRWFELVDCPDTRALKGPRYNMYAMLIEADRRGAGIALVPRAYVMDDIESGQLIVPWKISVPGAKDDYFVVPEQKQASQGVRIFLTWLLEVAAQYTHICRPL